MAKIQTMIDKLAIYFRANGELEVAKCFRDGKSVLSEWGSGKSRPVLALGLFFLDYVIANNNESQFIWSDQSYLEPRHALANQLEIKDWLYRLFWEDSGKYLFESESGDNRSGRKPSVRIVRLHTRSLPVANVEIYLGQRIQDMPTLKQLRERVLKVWRQHYQELTLGVAKLADKNPTETISRNANDDCKSPDVSADLQLSSFSFPINEKASELFRNPAVPITVDIRPIFRDYPKEVVERSMEKEVIKALNDKGYCYLDGHAGAGKTTLGLRIALGKLQSKGPKYYVSLNHAEAACGRDWGKVMADGFFSAKNSLLIVDDCHLNLGTVHTLMRAWELKGNGAKVLFLGQTITNHCKGLAALHSLFAGCFLSLTLTQEDLDALMRATIDRYLKATRLTEDGSPKRVDVKLKDAGGNVGLLTELLIEKMSKDFSWPINLTMPEIAKFKKKLGQAD